MKSKPILMEKIKKDSTTNGKQEDPEIYVDEEVTEEQQQADTESVVGTIIQVIIIFIALGVLYFLLRFLKLDVYPPFGDFVINIISNIWESILKNMNK